jgi:hypothetical protein
MAKKDIVGLKQQYLSEIASYEKRFFFVLLSICVALVVFFYNNPLIFGTTLSWWKLSVVFFIFLLFYEKFMFMDLSEKYDSVAKEFVSGKYTKFNFVSNNNNFLLYIFSRSKPLERIEFLVLLGVLILFIILLLLPFISVFLSNF